MTWALGPKPGPNEAWRPAPEAERAFVGDGFLLAAAMAVIATLGTAQVIAHGAMPGPDRPSG
ncbi:hypothetical protein ACFU8Q_09460 [Streptomyces sp. NPDC057543]|uniref:hypothetical protein n=1 Tax=Streptomyces sp. NPDC057543 TaxID=3346163 RepID=UPI003684ED3B